LSLCQDSIAPGRQTHHATREWHLDLLVWWVQLMGLCRCTQHIRGITQHYKRTTHGCIKGGKI
jgi:hypothetical protein